MSVIRTLSVGSIPGVQSDWFQATLTTTNNTPTVIWSFTTVSGSSYNIEADIAGKDATASGLICQTAMYGSRNGGAGAVNTAVLHVVRKDDFGLGHNTVTVGTSSNDTRLLVKGAADTTLYWAATIRMTTCS